MTPDLKPEAAGSSRVAAQGSVECRAAQGSSHSAEQHSAAQGSTAQAAQVAQRTEAAQAA